MESMMESKSKNNQEIIKSQAISLILSFVIFNALLKDIDSLILSSVVLLIVLSIIIKIIGRRINVGVEKNSKVSRRMR